MQDWVGNVVLLICGLLLDTGTNCSYSSKLLPVCRASRVAQSVHWFATVGYVPSYVASPEQHVTVLLMTCSVGGDT
jgi:hypothetical protein